MHDPKARLGLFEAVGLALMLFFGLVAVVTLLQTIVDGLP